MRLLSTIFVTILAASPVVLATEPDGKPKPETPASLGALLSSIDHDGHVGQAILAATRGKRILVLEKFHYAHGMDREAMFVRVELESPKDAREGTWHRWLFIVIDHEKEKSRIRIADGSFLLDARNPVTKQYETEDSILLDIDATDLSHIDFMYQTTW